MILPDPPILIITDRTQSPDPLESRALALFHGGCRWLSLREKSMEAPERRALLKRLVDLGATFGATVGVHDDLAAAASCGSALHLPERTDLSVARHELGADALIGQSCHDPQALRAVALAGADYATIGPVFPSASKPGYASEFGTDALIAAAENADLPVLLLGGIGRSTLPRLAACAAAGIAVMGEAMRTPEPEAWFRALALLWCERKT